MKIAFTFFFFVVIGFSVGDELGFSHSLSNTEDDRRRSIGARNGNSIPIETTKSQVKTNDGRQVELNSGSVPPLQPLRPGELRPMGRQPERQRLVVQQHATALKAKAAPSATIHDENSNQQNRAQQEEVFALRMLGQQKMRQQMQKQKIDSSSATVKEDNSNQLKGAQREAFVLEMLKQQVMRQQQQQQQQQQQIDSSATTMQKDDLNQRKDPQQEVLALQMIRQHEMQQQHQQQEIDASSTTMQEDNSNQQNGAGQPAFVPEMLKQEGMQEQQRQVDLMQAETTEMTQGLGGGPSSTASGLRISEGFPNVPSNIDSANQEAIQTVKRLMTYFGILLSSGIMPRSASQLIGRNSHKPKLREDSVNEVDGANFHQGLESQEESDSENDDSQAPMFLLPSLAFLRKIQSSLKASAEARPVTLETLETAILMRQQRLMQKHQRATTTSTTTTAPSAIITSSTTESPVKDLPTSKEVVNAPREYYPVGYDRNLDNNFASRVELPDTSFYCGDQKHFPGLYADEEHGCSVFHVCALTDDGLIMKSFLCPESTLFDQTVLKCNWWFYVDCKSSKKLYDSNIPISKSYQLMKALAFFSGYKNHENGTSSSSTDAL